jgi:hypothetical protein
MSRDPKPREPTDANSTTEVTSEGEQARSLRGGPSSAPPSVDSAWRCFPDAARPTSRRQRANNWMARLATSRLRWRA